MSKVLVITSWNPQAPQQWLFTLRSDGRTVTHGYWSGSAWQVQALPASPVALAANAELTGRYVSDLEWHIYAPTADGNFVHWWYGAKTVHVETIRP